MATRGTGVRLGHTAGTTITPREKLPFVLMPLCLNASRLAQDRTLGRIVPGGVRFHSQRRAQPFEVQRGVNDAEDDSAGIDRWIPKVDLSLACGTTGLELADREVPGLNGAPKIAAVGEIHPVFWPHHGAKAYAVRINGAEIVVVLIELDLRREQRVARGGRRFARAPPAPAPSAAATGACSR